MTGETPATMSGGSPTGSVSSTEGRRILCHSEHERADGLKGLHGSAVVMVKEDYGLGHLQ